MSACWQCPGSLASNGPIPRHDPEDPLLPLIAETLILCTIAFLTGFGLSAWLLKRRRRQSFLDY